MEELESGQSTGQPEECPYGEDCTANNTSHFQNYKHSYVPELLEFSRPDTEIRPETMLDRLEATKPYNIFFNAIGVLPETSQELNTIYFTDLLCPSLGQLKASLQINFLVEMTWLIDQYKLRNLEKLPLTVLDGGDCNENLKEYIQSKFPNITHQHVEIKTDAGCHHSKIGILLYEDNSVRIVVSTANLFFEDWSRFSNAIWVSPRCPRLPENSRTDGESDTQFKKSFISYLRKYKLACLSEWIDIVVHTDFSSVRVFFLASVPGFHTSQRKSPCHLLDMSNLLARYCKLPPRTRDNNDGPSNWPILVQTSAIGSFGKHPSTWLRGIFLQTVSKHTQGGASPLSRAPIKVIYPSVDNVLSGVFDPDVVGSPFPYYKKVNEKQRWFQDFLHQWKADQTKRSGLMSHMKSYCRISPCSTKMAWFFLTSANLSGSGWGREHRKRQGIQMMSYEAGVLFFPQFFDEEYFQIASQIAPQSDSRGKLFPLKYDLPLTAYRFCDYPYCHFDVEENGDEENKEDASEKA